MSASAGIDCGFPPTLVREQDAATLLVVDRRPLVRRGIVATARRGLGWSASGFRCFSDASAALPELDPAPDVLVVGVPELQSAGPAGPHASGLAVLCVVDGERSAEVHAGLAAGADGLLVFDLIDAQTLRESCLGVLAGAAAVPAELRDCCATIAAVTPRGLDVLGGLAEGLHDEEIARRLGISTSSVRKHLGNAQERLGARTRTQAVAAVVRRGLV
ncbi:MAG: response regulator transcription factor [Solirubrobacteraceae bacterium]